MSPCLASPIYLNERFASGDDKKISAQRAFNHYECFSTPSHNSSRQWVFEAHQKCANKEQE